MALGRLYFYPSPYYCLSSSWTCCVCYHSLVICQFLITCYELTRLFRGTFATTIDQQTIRVLDGRMKKALVYSYPLSTQRSDWALNQIVDIVMHMLIYDHQILVDNCVVYRRAIRDRNRSFNARNCFTMSIGIHRFSFTKVIEKSDTLKESA